MVTGISQSGGDGLLGLFRAIRKEQEEAVAVSTSESLISQTVESASLQPVSSFDTSNLMSHNFASAEQEDSKYIKAKIVSLQSDSNMANRQNAILNSAMAQITALEDGNNYAERSRIGRQAARSILAEGQQSVREESERNLEEIKDGIEEKAQEAARPKDENGKPIAEATTAENIGEAAEVPEISGSDMAPAPEVPSASTPEVSAEAVVASTPDEATAPAPSTPSVDTYV